VPRRDEILELSPSPDQLVVLDVQLCKRGVSTALERVRGLHFGRQEALNGQMTGDDHDVHQTTGVPGQEEQTDPRGEPHRRPVCRTTPGYSVRIVRSRRIRRGV